MPLHELNKKGKLQERFMFIIQDFIDRLKTLCMTIFRWGVAWSLKGNAAAHR